MNVDWERINSFITEDNEEEREWLKEMIGSLLENYEERLKELDELFLSKDNEKLKSLLHQMKGVVANFGLEKLRLLTIKAEDLSKEGKVDESISVSKQFREIWIETKKELKEKLGL